MDWIKENWINISAIIGGVVTLASVIVKLTPSEKDDAVLSKIVKVLRFLSLAKK